VIKEEHYVLPFYFCMRVRQWWHRRGEEGLSICSVREGEMEEEIKLLLCMRKRGRGKIYGCYFLHGCMQMKRVKPME
jgi:hypothetical protein